MNSAQAAFAGLTTADYEARHPPYPAIEVGRALRDFQASMHFACEKYARRVVWAGSISEALAESAILGISCWQAQKHKLWSIEHPYFDHWAEAVCIWQDRLGRNRLAAERLEREMRRLAFKRTPGEEMIAEANKLLAVHRIKLPEDMVIMILRNIAHSTLPRRGRGRRQ